MPSLEDFGIYHQQLLVVYNRTVAKVEELRFKLRSLTLQSFITP